MNPTFTAAFAFLLGFVPLTLAAEPQKPREDVVLLKRYIVEEKSLAKSGFAFEAKFRHHIVWAGVKELVIIKVEARSAAKKAGLEVGEKIIQIREVKVDGLGIKELQREFERKSINGKIPLIIQPKDSDKKRAVELQFNDATLEK